MAEQLWRTWAFSGMDGRPGLNVYAVSKGLRDVTRAVNPTLERAYLFDLPEGVGHSTRIEQVPVSLAFLVEGSERVLAHRVYVGPDGHGRWGNYFVHVVADLPQSFTAHDAIRLWDSPFWCRSVGDTPPGVRLEEVHPSQLLLPGPHADDPLPAELRDAAAFLLAAYLSLADGQRVTVVGLPDVVAILLAAATTALPQAMLGSFGFSTYEAHPDRAQGSVVGTCGAPLVQGKPRAGYTLPPESRKGFVIDTIAWELGGDPADGAFRYANWAADRLVLGGDREELQRVIARAEGATHVDHLLASVQWLETHYGAGGLAWPEVAWHLAPSRARSSLGLPKVRAALLRASADARWAQAGAAKLRELAAEAKTETGLFTALQQLSRDAKAAVGEAIEAADFPRARDIFDGIIRPLPGAADAAERFLAALEIPGGAGGEVSEDLCELVGLLAADCKKPSDDQRLRPFIGRSPGHLLAMLRAIMRRSELRTPLIAWALGNDVAMDEHAWEQLVRLYPEEAADALGSLAPDLRHVGAVEEGIRALVVWGGSQGPLMAFEALARSTASTELRTLAAEAAFGPDLPEEPRFQTLSMLAARPDLVALLDRGRGPNLLKTVDAYLVHKVPRSPQVLKLLASLDELPQSLRPGVLALAPARVGPESFRASPAPEDRPVSLGSDVRDLLETSSPLPADAASAAADTPKRAGLEATVAAAPSVRVATRGGGEVTPDKAAAAIRSEYLTGDKLRKLAEERAPPGSLQGRHLSDLLQVLKAPPAQQDESLLAAAAELVISLPDDQQRDLWGAPGPYQESIGFLLLGLLGDEVRLNQVVNQLAVAGAPHCAGVGDCASAMVLEARAKVAADVPPARVSGHLRFRMCLDELRRARVDQRKYWLGVDKLPSLAWNMTQEHQLEKLVDPVEEAFGGGRADAVWRVARAYCLGRMERGLSKEEKVWHRIQLEVNKLRPKTGFDELDAAIKQLPIMTISDLRSTRSLAEWLRGTPQDAVGCDSVGREDDA